MPLEAKRGYLSFSGGQEVSRAVVMLHAEKRRVAGATRVVEEETLYVGCVR